MSDYRLLNFGNGTIQLLVALFLIAFSPAVAGWVTVFLGRLAAHRAEKGRAVEARRRAEAKALDYLVETYRPSRSSGYASSPDGSLRRSLPRAWRAPCGEDIRIHSTNDSGPRAA